MNDIEEKPQENIKYKNIKTFIIALSITNIPITVFIALALVVTQYLHDKSSQTLKELESYLDTFNNTQVISIDDFNNLYSNDYLTTLHTAISEVQSLRDTYLKSGDVEVISNLNIVLDKLKEVNFSLDQFYSLNLEKVQLDDTQKLSIIINAQQLNALFVQLNKVFENRISVTDTLASNIERGLGILLIIEAVLGTLDLIFFIYKKSPHNEDAEVPTAEDKTKNDGDPLDNAEILAEAERLLPLTEIFKQDPNNLKEG